MSIATILFRHYHVKSVYGWHSKDLYGKRQNDEPTQNPCIFFHFIHAKRFTCLHHQPSLYVSFIKVSSLNIWCIPKWSAAKHLFNIFNMSKLLLVKLLECVMDGPSSLKRHITCCCFHVLVKDPMMLNCIRKSQLV